MDTICDRKSFEVGGHWPLWRGWKKPNDHAVTDKSRTLINPTSHERWFLRFARNKQRKFVTLLYASHESVLLWSISDVDKQSKLNTQPIRNYMSKNNRHSKQIPTKLKYNPQIKSHLTCLWPFCLYRKSICSINDHLMWHTKNALVVLEAKCHM